jgi:hypothetical protein
MSRKRFLPEKIVNKLRQADVELARGYSSVLTDVQRAMILLPTQAIVAIAPTTIMPTTKTYSVTSPPR